MFGTYVIPDTKQTDIYECKVSYPSVYKSFFTSNCFFYYPFQISVTKTSTFSFVPAPLHKQISRKSETKFIDPYSNLLLSNTKYIIFNA